MKNARMTVACTAALALAAGFSGCGWAAGTDAATPYSPYVRGPQAKRVLWGDTHLHTSLSLDARAFGVRLDPEAAFRFARGEEVVATTGQPVRLSRPLDFLVVSDHSDGLGAMNEIIAGNPALLGDPTIRRWHEMIKAGGDSAFQAYMDVVVKLTNGPVPEGLRNNEQFARSIWEPYTRYADKYDEPGRFTALVGYEWTSTPGGNNLHRVVIYRDGADKASRQLPFTMAESPDPADLWKALRRYEEATGGQVLAIAHNGNLSNGLMFSLSDYSGRPMTRAYAEERMRWEPVYEVTQIKGDGEAHPLMSPNDEFADYETWDVANMGPVKKTPEMIPYEYAREALKNGLRLEQSLGANPFKFGMIGSTDSHTALATAEEDNFFGKMTQVEPSPTRWSKVWAKIGDTEAVGWQNVSSGYAAVWATENTREAIFDAIKRREVYATTGPRITVRVFGGWDFGAADANAMDLASAGYARGVPMGGELSAAPNGKAPTLLIAAMRDPIGANLDRVQVVKGWVDAEGETHEHVYDVAWSGDRKPGQDGKLPAVGNTVDVANATWTNTIGSAQLATAWRDPDFDPSLRAFYYARVLEIPTPRWTAYDAKRFGVQMDPVVPMVTQERAYTSPIWYTP
jgi:hypothetical protein